MATGRRGLWARLRAVPAAAADFSRSSTVRIMMLVGAAISFRVQRLGWDRDEGQDTAEYGLLLALISIAAIGIAILVGPQLDSMFHGVINGLQTGSTPGPGSGGGTGGSAGGGAVTTPIPQPTPRG